MLLWPVDKVVGTDATTPPTVEATVSSAVATASSAIATASSAIATASSAIATASSAIATASSVIGTDPSATAVDRIACDDDTTELCDTTADTSTTTTTTTSTVTSGVTSAIVGDGDDCSKVASALRLGHGADDSPALQVDDNRGGTGRSLDIVGPRRRADGFNRIVVRPRTIGLKMFEKIMLTAVSMFFEKLELAVYLSLYKLKLLYTTLIAPVLGI
ncbi:uncharacterized protein LOC111033204 isoform X2 [Myzus persicae]|nr:uncharacterized protein LOC111033204 isoform X2 [Myzus persicae]